MAKSQGARAAAGAVLGRLPWSLTPRTLREQALRHRVRRVAASAEGDLERLSTDSLLALLCSPATTADARLAEPITRLLNGRTLRGSQRRAAFRAAALSGVGVAGVDLMANESAAWRALDADRREQLATLISNREVAPSLAQLRAALGADADALAPQAAVAGRAWNALAELDAEGVRLPRAERSAAAVAAARAGDLAAALTLARGARTSHERGGAAALANAADHLALLHAGSVLETAPLAPAPHAPGRPEAVLYVASQSMPHRSGGYATRTHGIVVAERAAGWDVRVLTRLGFPYTRWDERDRRVAKNVDVVDGVEYHRALRGDRRRFPETPLLDHVNEFAKDVERHAVEHGASVIHSASFYQTGLAAAIAARRLGLPFVYELRGLEELYRRSREPRFAGTEEAQFLLAMELDICRHADAVLAITRALAADLVAAGIDPARISVLGNGVVPAEFSPSEPDLALRAELGLASETIVGYAGSIVDYEGLELLVDATEILDRDDVAVVIVGDGPHLEAVKRRAAASPRAGAIHFVGRVPFSEVPRYLSIFDVMPFPRIALPVTEAISPMKPFEAMAMEKAIIVSDVAALAEIVDEGTTGITFAHGDPAALAAAIATLAGDPALRARLGAAARESIVATATWEHRVEAADAAYRAFGARPLAGS